MKGSGGPGSRSLHIYQQKDSKDAGKCSKITNYEVIRDIYIYSDIL